MRSCLACTLPLHVARGENIRMRSACAFCPRMRSACPFCPRMHSALTRVRILYFTVYNNSAAFGGGVYAHTASAIAELYHCNIFENEARGVFGSGGGGVYAKGDGTKGITFFECRIHHNEARGHYGGGAFSAYKSRATFLGCAIHDNVAVTDGGGLRFRGGTYVLADTHILSNIASKDGGGIYVDIQENADVSISNSSIQNNVAHRGSGMFVGSGNTLLRNTLIAGNTLVPLNVLATSSRGSNVLATLGIVQYKLPTPPGYWLPISECRVSREPCVESWTSRGKACIESADACSLVADSTISSMVNETHTSVRTMIATVPQSACMNGIPGNCADPQPCMPRTLVQP